MTTSSDIIPVVAPANLLSGPPQGQWTYADYAALTAEGEYFEIINGVVYMSLAPNLGRQGSNLRILIQLYDYIEKPGLGRVFGAPVDVELAPKIVVQPDVVVVLKENLDILHPSHIIGRPDLVVEIISPSTAGYDRRVKQDMYSQYGIPEYWIADPASKTVELLRLDGAAYVSQGVYQGQAQLPTRIIPSFPVAVAEFFAD